MKKLRVWLALTALLAACGRGPTPTPTPAASVTPVTIDLPTGAPPASATPAETATLPPTPLPGATLTPAPTVTLSAQTVVERGHLLPGFSLTVYAEVAAPTSLAYGPDQRLYAATEDGFIYAIADLDDNHRGDSIQQFAAGLTLPLGLAWVGDELFVSEQGRVLALRDDDGDGAADTQRVVVSRLPSFGQHSNDGLALGGDGFIYMGQGSTCDHCVETDPRSGTILRFRPDGSELTVYARGLRNPYDLAFNANGDLFATDNGRDDLGRNEPGEELNLIQSGQNYGWPDCWPGRAAAACAGSVQPVITFTAHTSANGLVFYNGGEFPPEYIGSAFVAILGPVNLFPDDPERGVMRVQLVRNGAGYTATREWFLDLPDGRPVDLTFAPDGGLYVADWENGLILRIVYDG